MKLISHRGNLDGPNPELENQPVYIETALKNGYDVEIDVWNIGGDWLLGHDYPLHTVNLNFLENPNLLCHAKNLDALSLMLGNDDIHCFWHQEDHYTITSRGYILSYPGYSTTGKNTICMKPEHHDLSTLQLCHAACSDFVRHYRWINTIKTDDNFSSTR